MVFCNDFTSLCHHIYLTINNSACVVFNFLCLRCSSPFFLVSMIPMKSVFWKLEQRSVNKVNSGTWIRSTACLALEASAQCIPLARRVRSLSYRLSSLPAPILKTGGRHFAGANCNWQVIMYMSDTSVLGRKPDTNGLLRRGVVLRGSRAWLLVISPTLLFSSTKFSHFLFFSAPCHSHLPSPPTPATNNPPQQVRYLSHEIKFIESVDKISN